MENRTEGKAVRSASVRLTPLRGGGVSRNVGLSMNDAEVERVRAAAVQVGARSFSEYVREAALQRAARDLKARRRAA